MAIRSTNISTGRIIERKTHYNWLSKDIKKHLVTMYVMIYKAMSHVTVPRMRELFPAPSLVS
jgi:hypothetical protein